MILRRTALGLPLLALDQGAAAWGWTIAKRLEDTQIHSLTLSPEGLPWIAGTMAGRGFAACGAAFERLPSPEPFISLAAAGGEVLCAIGGRGLWRSADAGHSWILLREESGLTAVLAAAPPRLYALGAKKTILESADKGQTWTPIAAAAEPPTNSQYSVYWWGDFPTSRVGIITGASRPPRAGRTSELPAWRDPARSGRRQEWPGASITLETRDGGVTWKHSVTSLFGRISRVRYSPEGRGLVLVTFHDAFPYPSEVFAIDLRRGGVSERVFREAKRAVTDLLLFNGPLGFLAAIEPPRDPAHSTLGRLHLLSSTGLAVWEEEPLEEAVEAGCAWLAGRPGEGLWAATDTGVVLRSTRTPAAN